MSTVVIFDPVQDTACLVSEDSGRAFGPAVSGREGSQLLEAFLSGQTFDPAMMEPAQLWTEWQTFIAVVMEEARPPGGEPAPPDENLPTTEPQRSGGDEQAVPAGPGENPTHDEPPAPEPEPEPGQPTGPDAPATPGAVPAGAPDEPHPNELPAPDPGRAPAPEHPQPAARRTTPDPGYLLCPACEAQGLIGELECPACRGTGQLPALAVA